MHIISHVLFGGLPVDEQFVHYCLILGDVDNMSLYLKKSSRHWTDSLTTPPGPKKTQQTLDIQFDHPTRHTDALAGGANIGWTTQPNGRR